MQQVLHRIGAIIVASQYGGFVGVHGESLLVLHFLFCTVEAGHCAAVVVTVQPLVCGAEVAYTEFRIRLDGFHGAHQGFKFNAVHDR